MKVKKAPASAKVHHPKKHVTPAKKKGMTERNAYLTWTLKNQIHDFKQAWLSDNTELSIEEQRDIINSENWRDDLTDYIRIHDPYIGEEDVGRWIHAHPWIKDPLGMIPLKKCGKSIQDTTTADNSFMVPIRIIPNPDIPASSGKSLPSSDNNNPYENADNDMDPNGNSLSPPVLSPQGAATAASAVPSPFLSAGNKGTNVNGYPSVPRGKRIYNVGENESILRRVLETDDTSSIIIMQTPETDNGTGASGANMTLVEQTDSNAVVDNDTPTTSTSSESFNIQLQLSPSVSIVVEHGPEDRDPLNGNTAIMIGENTQVVVPPEGEPMDVDNRTDDGEETVLPNISRLPDVTITEAEDSEMTNSTTVPVPVTNEGANGVLETPGTGTDQGEFIAPVFQKPATPAPASATVPSSMETISATPASGGNAAGPLPSFDRTFFPNGRSVGNDYGTLNGNASSQSQAGQAGPSTSSAAAASIPEPPTAPVTSTKADVKEVIKNVRESAFTNVDLLKNLDPADDNSTSLENYNKMHIIIEGLLSVASMVTMDEGVKRPLKRLRTVVSRLMGKDILPHNHGDTFVKVVNANSRRLRSMKKERGGMLTPISSESSISNDPATSNKGVPYSAEANNVLFNVVDVGCEVEVGTLEN